MSSSVYKKLEMVGTSPSSISDAINNAIATASATETVAGWFEVTEIRGHIHDGKVSEYQVALKVGVRSA